MTPDGQSLEQSRVEAEVRQYGAYIEVSDLLDMTGFDTVINDGAELLGEQLGTVIEWVTPTPCAPARTCSTPAARPAATR